MHCKICSSTEIKPIQEKVNGYIDGTSYEVFLCSKCETQFINEDYDKRIYETIYSAQGNFGYERYAKYVEEIKNHENPLEWLSTKEPAYLYVYHYLTGRTASKWDAEGNAEKYVPYKNLRILEVGCGDGYLTYAMNQAGHNCIGIDISIKAIEVAKKNFKGFYSASDVKEIIGSFDLIISTETIEHLDDPVKFVKECKRILKPNGKILLTTANKDYRSPNTTWQTEAPPVHRFWMGHKSFEAVAKTTHMKCEFLPLVMPLDMERNNVVAYWSSRGTNKFGSVLDKDGRVFNSRPSKLRNFARDVAMWKPIRYICNAIVLYSLLPFGFLRIKEAPTLGVLLKK